MAKIKSIFNYLRFFASPRRAFLVYSIFRKLRKTNLLFFFPTNCLGGAEKVHADIVKTVSDQKPVVFFTRNNRSNTAYAHLFPKQESFDLTSLLIPDNYRSRVLASLLISWVNHKNQLVLFTSNSVFFYRFLPYLKEKDNKFIDLTHSFMGVIEQFALPLVQKLDMRLVITPKNVKKLQEQYQKHSISEIYMKRVRYILNYVKPIRKYIEKSQSDSLNIIFIARNGIEKRVHFIESIIRKIAFKKELKIQFTIIGNFEELAKKELPNTKFTGLINSQKQVYEELSQNHIILLTSSYEGFPNVIMEAMYNSVVPICTNVGGLSDHLQHSQNGFLVDNPKNEKYVVDKTIEHIIQLYEDRRLLFEMSKNAFEYAQNNFRTFEEFRRDYRTLILGKE